MLNMWQLFQWSITPLNNGRIPASAVESLQEVETDNPGRTVTEAVVTQKNECIDIRASMRAVCAHSELAS